MTFSYENPEEIQLIPRIKLLEKAIAFLNGLEEEERLINDVSSYQAFIYIAIYCNVLGNDKIELHALKGVEKIFIKTLGQLYKNHGSFELNNCKLVVKNAPLCELNEPNRHSTVLICVLYAMNIINKNCIVKFSFYLELT